MNQKSLQELMGFGPETPKENKPVLAVEKIQPRKPKKVVVLGDANTNTIVARPVTAPVDKQKKVQGKKSCFKCGQPGHIAKECKVQMMGGMGAANAPSKPFNIKDFTANVEVPEEKKLSEETKGDGQAEFTQCFRKCVPVHPTYSKLLDSMSKAKQSDQSVETYDSAGYKTLANSKSGADCVWTDKTTQAKIFVGDVNCAADEKLLKKLGCYVIINAQSLWSENFHEYNKDFQYVRFPIAETDSMPFNCYTPDGALRFLNPLIDTIEEYMKAGDNVFIHCIAGKHRAGACMVAWLMYKQAMTVSEAIKFAQQRRKRINPLEQKVQNGTLAPLLYGFEEGLKSDPKRSFRTSNNSWDDYELILKSAPKKKWDKNEDNTLLKKGQFSNLSEKMSIRFK